MVYLVYMSLMNYTSDFIPPLAHIYMVFRQNLCSACKVFNKCLKMYETRDLSQSMQRAMDVYTKSKESGTPIKMTKSHE